MSLVYKWEMHSYFTKWTGYVYLAVFILLMNLGFYFHNLRAESAELFRISYLIQFISAATAPIITAGLLSLSKNKGVDRTLLYMPVGSSQTVLGKFFAASTLLAATVLLTGLWFFIFFLLGAGFPFLWMLGFWAGMLFSGAAYISLGMLISCIARNPAAAAVVSFVVFFLMFRLDALFASHNELDSLAQALTGGRFLLTSSAAGFFKGLSFSDKLQSIAAGLISPAHLLFFILFSGALLFITAGWLEKRRWG
ncbi:MAG: ABC transporter permease [Oscillospiraceae bacterium]|nr:ABC transporter permease [Oscillospiraceae bacterium]